MFLSRSRNNELAQPVRNRNGEGAWSVEIVHSVAEELCSWSSAEVVARDCAID